MTTDEYQQLLTDMARFHDDGHSPLEPCTCAAAMTAIYEQMTHNLVMGAFNAFRNPTDSVYSFVPTTRNHADGGA